MGKMNVLDENGDTQHSWDTPEEAAVVEGVFKGLLGRGYIAARMGADGSSGEQITAFDAGAGAILLMPPLRGG
jgi:hypothetical protein